MILSRGQFIGALSSFCFFLPAAFAAVTVTPQVPWTPDSNGIVYYSLNTLSPTLDTEVGFRSIDATRTTANETGTRLNMIRVTVQSDKVFAIASGQQLVVTAWATMSSGTTKPVPIAYAGGDCVANSNCQGNLNLSYLYAAQISNQQSLEIGFYPQDVCAGVNSDGSSVASGCSVGSFDAPAANAGTLMTLTFYVTLMTSTGGVPALADLGSESAVLKFKFQNGKPTFSCDDINNVYFPADSAILLNTQVFTGTSAAASLAPVGTILAIAKRNGTPNVTTTAFQSNNDLVGRLAYHAGTQVFSGFVNATAANDVENTYTIKFTGRDLSGALADFSNACLLPDVQALEVKGFLKKSNCFIATAAFRSTGAEPVMLLRRFRDHVLLQNFLGRAFVHAYYRWSPPAAEWLIENPQFRIPVLLALIPVQALAWVFLDPLLRLSLLVGLSLSLGLVLWLVRRRLDAGHTQ